MTLAPLDPLNRVTGLIIQAAVEVHRHLGPGLLESAYQTCLGDELQALGLTVERNKRLPLVYKGIALDCGYKLDILVNGLVVIELKCVDQFAPIHIAQILTYLKLTRCPAGLLLNFHVPLMKKGIRRVLNSRATESTPFTEGIDSTE